MEEDESLVSERAALLDGAVSDDAIRPNNNGGAAFSLRSVRNSVLAGYAAGTCGILVGHPLDSIKVLIQMKGAGGKSGGGGSSTKANLSSTATFAPCSQCAATASASASASTTKLGGSGPLRAKISTSATPAASAASSTSTVSAARMAPKRSLLSLYAGVQGPLMSVGVVQAINFAVYDSCRRLLHKRRHPNAPPDAYLHDFSLADVAISSSVAGGTISVITSPLQAIKTNQQIHPQSFRTAMTQLYFQSGGSKGRGSIRGFFTGFPPHLFCDSFGRMIYLSCYELAKRYLDKSRSGNLVEDSSASAARLTLQERMACAGASGMICWAIIYPADVIRSRMYANAIAERRPGPWQMAKSIYQEERSFRPFYRGLGVTVIRAAPVAAAVLPVYDFAHAWLSSH